MDLARFIYLASKEDEMIRREQSKLMFTMTCHRIVEDGSKSTFQYVYTCIPVEDGVTIEGSFPSSFQNEKNPSKNPSFCFLIRRADRRLFCNGSFVLYEGVLKDINAFFGENQPDKISFCLKSRNRVLYHSDVDLQPLSPEDRHIYISQNVKNTFQDIFGILICSHTRFDVDR